MPELVFAVSIEADQQRWSHDALRASSAWGAALLAIHAAAIADDTKALKIEVREAESPKSST